MAEILQLAHLVQHDRMADVDVGRGRIETELDAQRLARRGAPRELLREFVFDQQFVAAAFGDGERALHIVGDRKACAAGAEEALESVVMLAACEVKRVR